MTTYVRVANDMDPFFRGFSGDVFFLHLLDNGTGWVVDLGNQPVFWAPGEKHMAWLFMDPRF
jgi:hypothetical protein